MKTVLKIDIGDDGISCVECHLNDDLDLKRLVSSFLVMMTRDENFKTVVMSSAAAMISMPEKVKELTKISEISAQAKILGGMNNKTKS
ncbi:MAG: hypothetical protein ACI4TM_01675 [Candidatus Cryptobacteroides sp.]